MTEPSTTESPSLLLARVLCMGNRGLAKEVHVAELLDRFADYVIRRHGTGVYSDIEIIEALLAQHIVIHPLIPENIRGSSVDVTLGRFFYVLDSKSKNGYNPFDEKDVIRYFGNYKTAQEHWDWSRDNKGQWWEGIPKHHPIIVLKPGERILCHTHEFIGINPPGTTEMRARSSWGRNGVVVCKDAGWGDPGYINRWTMEVQNDNPEAVVLPVGERIGQIIFHHTGPCRFNYGVGGKYQGGTTLKDVVKNWTPQALLPRAYKDERKLPLPEGRVPSLKAIRELLEVNAVEVNPPGAK